MFRTPTDTLAYNTLLYDQVYHQDFTTELPNDQELAEMKRSNFVHTQKDYSGYLRALTQLGLKPGAKIFDYGCSWGYGSFQLAQAGFEVTSFEVSANRSRYAHEKLGLTIVKDMEAAVTNLALSFDCFFSAHVLEHLPSPAQSFAYAMRLLKVGGVFVSFTPNGSQRYRVAAPDDWNKLWGDVHPNFIDDVFLDRNFKLSPRALGSTPHLGNVSLPAKSELKLLDDLDRWELFFVAQKVGEAWG